MKVMQPYHLRNENPPVSVLIGNHCGSSGENTALAFVGRPGTKLFGQPSAGYTIGNLGCTLPDSSIILIAESPSTDRTGKEYKGAVYPDVTITQPLNNPDDMVLEAAKKWLISKSVCTAEKKN